MMSLFSYEKGFKKGVYENDGLFLLWDLVPIFTIIYYWPDEIPFKLTKLPGTNNIVFGYI